MTPEEQQSEMSMEDILSSIKDILESDSQTENPETENTPAAAPNTAVSAEPETASAAPSSPAATSVEPEPEDDVFDLSQAMIVDEGKEEPDAKIELDEIGPDFDITPKDDEPLLSPEDIELPDFKAEDADLDIGLTDTSAAASTKAEEDSQTAPDSDDFSFNIDELLQSASEAITEDSAAKQTTDTSLTTDLPEIDTTSEPILQEQTEDLTVSLGEASPNEDPYTPMPQADSSSQPQATPAAENPATETSVADIPAAVNEEPQEIPEASFEEVEEEIAPEPTEPEKTTQAPIMSEPEPKSEPQEKEDAADVSADIINNFAKMFAEQTQERQEKEPEPAPAPEIPVSVSSMGDGNKTIEQVVEGVIQGIVAASVNAEMTKNVDIAAYAKQEIHAQTRAWLEVNLPKIVEAAVQKEIERVMVKVGR